MKCKSSGAVTIIIVLLAFAVPLQLAAQHTHYKLIDIPTLGGPAAWGQVDGPGTTQFINSTGIVVGGTATSIPDPSCSGCFLGHAFHFQDGILTDLGTLSGVNWSHATSINASGWVTGGSSTVLIDPLTGGPEERAVLWKNGEVVDLGTLSTGIESAALYVKDGGEVVGFSTIDNSVDPFAFVGLGPFPSPTHAFIWRDGAMQDLGTLGGPDSFAGAGCNNETIGLVAGTSFTDSNPNPNTGFPTLHPFLWENGRMRDLGSLGGTIGIAQCSNNRGQVIGFATLPGDVSAHPFLWDHGVMTDLGTFGGDFGQAIWINNAGDVVGRTDLPDGGHDAFLWRDHVMTDLGTLGATSTALQINSRRQIIGTSRINENTVHAFLWENSGPMVDLNTLIPPNSSLQLAEADNINDRGEIVGRGLPAGCDDLDSCGHAFVLIPCNRDVSCESGDVAATGMQSGSRNKSGLPNLYRPARLMPFQTLPMLRNHLMQR